MDKQAVIPADLSDKAINELFKVGAHIGSGGNPLVMDSFKDPPSVLQLVLLTAGLTFMVYAISEMSNYYEIKNNWSYYRCMPSVAPFAKFYGHDLAETMKFCVGESVKEHAPGVIDPIYQGINKITGVVDGVFEQVKSIGGGVSGLLRGFQDFVINFVNSFRLLGTRVRMSFINIKEIFARVYGLFIAFAYAAISAITFGENLFCNPLVKFLGTITGVDICCFAPDTRIVMADGSSKAIHAVCIGDRLAGDSVVESTYRFTGHMTRMVKIYGVEVSANHYIEHKGRMIPAGVHPDRFPIFRIRHLCCLGTSDHRIPVLTEKGSHIFADYEESSDPAVISKAQSIAETMLNEDTPGPTVLDYSLGLDPTVSVFMYDGSWKQLANLKIGDQVRSGAFVSGLISEVCELQSKTPAGIWLSAAQLIHYEGKWTRAANIWPTVKLDRSILNHIMTDSNNPITIRSESEVWNVRDYAEVNSLEIQKPYDAILGQS